MKSFLVACIVSGAASFCAWAAEFLAHVNRAAIRSHVEFLADDLLEGRETGTRGYAIAARYVASQFAAAGLKPGGDAGSFLQNVPFRSAQLEPDSAEFAIVGSSGDAVRYKFGEDFVVFPSRLAESTEASAAAVYAGHGIVAPHLGIDDYAGLSVRGKFVDGLGQVWVVDDRNAMVPCRSATSMFWVGDLYGSIAACHCCTVLARVAATNPSSSFDGSCAVQRKLRKRPFSRAVGPRCV